MTDHHRRLGKLWLAAGRACLAVWLAAHPAAAQEPPPRQPAPLPQVPPVAPPVEEPFGPGRVRLPLLAGQAAAIGTTPKPTPQVQAEYNRYVDSFVDPQNTLDLIVGRTRLIVFKVPPLRNRMPDETILERPLIISPTEYSLVAKKVGTTVLNLFFRDEADPTKEKVLSYLVRVLPDPEAKERIDHVYKVLEDEINHAFPDSVIHLALVGDKLVLSGQAKDIADAFNILRVARANAPGTIAADRIPVGRVDVNIQAAGGAPAVAAPGTDIPPPEQTLDNFLVAGGPNIINLLRVPGEQQVMLQITVAEVNRSAARSIGIDFITRIGNNSFANTTGSIFNQVSLLNNVAGGAAAAAANSASASNLANVLASIDSGQTLLAINALRTLSLARSLAEPNLTTLNGRPANFQSGGQFPVPVVTGATAVGLQGVQFVPFGVSLQFTPTITDKDRIRLRLAAEVSTRDNATSATIGGTSVPSLNTRNFQSTVELRDGQTLAVAGLIQGNFGSDATRIPFLGDAPLIGHLFGFDRTSCADQELVILVTPRLVHPLDGKLPTLPGADLVSPNDLEFYLLGHLQHYGPDGINPGKLRAAEKNCILGPVGHSFDRR